MRFVRYTIDNAFMFVAPTHNTCSADLENAFQTANLKSCLCSVYASHHMFGMSLPDRVGSRRRRVCPATTCRATSCSRLKVNVTPLFASRLCSKRVWMVCPKQFQQVEWKGSGRILVLWLREPDANKECSTICSTAPICAATLGARDKEYVRNVPYRRHRLRQTIIQRGCSTSRMIPHAVHKRLNATQASATRPPAHPTHSSAEQRTRSRNL